MSENGFPGEDGLPTVLVVDDQPAIVDGHAARLKSSYDVRRAYSGGEAFEKLDGAVDVVLLDRRMSALTGEEVLSEVREREFGCRVAVLTGVEPSFDVVDVGFDDYLRKPVGARELLGAVERMLQRARYDRRLQEFFALASKAAALETERDPAELGDHPEHQALQADLRRLCSELDETLADLPAEERYAIAARPNTVEGDRPDV